MSQPSERGRTEVKVQPADSGSILPKRDGQGRIYREMRCPNCRAFLGDEYIRKGRIRLKCWRCNRITIMEFRPYRSEKGRAPVTKAKDKKP